MDTVTETQTEMDTDTEDRKDAISNGSRSRSRSTDDDVNEGDVDVKDDDDEYDGYVVPLGAEEECVYHDPNFLSLAESQNYYEDLLNTIPWKKTPKINRWVHLCQSDQGEDQDQAAASDAKDAEREGEDDDNGDGDATAAATTTTTTTTKKSSSIQYSYRDNPSAAGVSSRSSSSKEMTVEVEIPTFPNTIESIRRSCQEWYQQKIMTKKKLKQSKKHKEDNSDDSEDDLPPSPLPPSFNVCLLNFYEDGQQRIGWHSDREELGRTTPICSVSLGATRQFLIRSKEQWNDQASLDLQSGSLVVMENLCQQQYLHAVPRQTDVLEGRINLTFRCKNNEHDETTQGEELHRQRDNFMDQIAEESKPSTEAWSIQQHQHQHGNDTTTPPTSTTTTTTKSFVPDSEVAAGPIFGNCLNLLVPPESEKITIDIPTSLLYVVKTNLGAGRYSAAELEEQIIALHLQQQYRIVVRPFGIDGYVGLVAIHRRSGGGGGDGSGQEEEDLVDHNRQNDTKNDNDRITSMLLKLQSVHHVMRYHTHFRLQDCVSESQRRQQDDDFKEEMIPKEALYEHVKQLLMTKKMKVDLIEDEDASSNNSSSSSGGGSFRVSCERIGGPHAWQAPDVEYEIGGAFAEYYEDKNWTPKMRNYDVEIRADVVGNQVLIGTQLNVQDLSKGRHFLQYRNAVTIKANLAYVMSRLANLNHGDRLLDPFCGSGTLVLEAQQIYGGTLTCIGMDLSRRSAQGAAANAEAEGYGPDRCRFVCSDARGLRRHVDTGDNSVDAICSNLPWGIQTGQNQSTSDLQTMYEVFLRNSWYVLKPYGRVVMLVLRGLQLVRTVQKLSGRFRLVHVNVIRTTNNLPSIIVVEKLPVDVQRESLKSQLSHLNQFVSFSPEIYRSIHTEDVWDDNDERSRMTNRS